MASVSVKVWRQLRLQISQKISLALICTVPTHNKRLSCEKAIVEISGDDEKGFC
jgi:hypothetical protein